ncbi:uncharacterized protein BXZ73DRAFT_108353 [Epithele typhae]|uniref:uncharacterized protein n=1 Tax=Epithele typhae TaxID=378194 RepID=UPI0020086AA2|nr:uncharacterized protein BXZ73DRAFT_108353 [Epithele typhae]KAH9910927.1 hypothetical protein BXZ73DRAFT_108353 [Epithele typhae]
MDNIPQETFCLILRWTIQRPDPDMSSFNLLIERPRFAPPPGFYRWLPLRLVSRHWNETIASEKHLWSTVIARGPHAREWLMVCLVHSDRVPIDVILQLNLGHDHQDMGKKWSLFVAILPHSLRLRSLAVNPLNKADRIHLNDFFLSTTFPALTTLVFVSDTPTKEPWYTSPVTFEQHNAPALTTISVFARWQVPRPMVFARLKRVSLASGLTVLPMHVLGSSMPRRSSKSSASTEVRVECVGCEAADVFDYLPDTLADSIPVLPSLVGLRVTADARSFGFEGWTAGETHRVIVHCDIATCDVVSEDVLDGLGRFVDIIRCPDGPSTLELDGISGSLFTERAEWAALLQCFPKLTRLSIANTVSSWLSDFTLRDTARGSSSS